MSAKKSSSRKWFLLGLLLVLPVFILKELHILLAKKDRTTLSDSQFYKHNEIEASDKRLLIVIPGYNTGNYIERTMQSIFEQSYPNYHVVYIDGGSTDGSFEKVDGIVNHAGRRNQVTLIKRDGRAGQLESYYKAVHAEHDETVVVHLEGTDWLAHHDVLSHLNATYANQDVWLTYGQYLAYPSYRKGFQKPRPKRTVYRKKVHRGPWVMASLKTYYAGLFKELDVGTDDNFFAALDNELDMLLPVAEAAKHHVRFIPEVLYIHNQELTDHQIGNITERFTKALLPKLVEKQDVLAMQADILLFASGPPEQLESALQSIYRYVKGVHKVHVVYPGVARYQAEYDVLIKRYTGAQFIQAKDGTDVYHDLMPILSRVTCPVSFVAMLTDTHQVKEPIYIDQCIGALKNTGAYAFYFHKAYEKLKWRKLGLSAKVISLVDGIYSSALKDGKNRSSALLDIGLYRKKQIKDELEGREFHDLRSLLDACSHLGQGEDTGLFFDREHVLEDNTIRR